MQRLRLSLLRCIIPARTTTTTNISFLTHFPRPDLSVKPEHKEGLPYREGDQRFNVIARDEIETRVLYCLKNYPFLDLKKLDLNKDFSEMGLDSLEVISAITSIEEEFNFVFPDNEFDNFKNFNQIVDILSSTPNVI